MNKKNILDEIININPNFTSESNQRNYPYFKDVKIGKSGDYDDLLELIGEASHEYDSYYTGFAAEEALGKNQRFASPIYCTVSDGRIIITELNCSYRENISGLKLKVPYKIKREKFQELKNNLDDSYKKKNLDDFYNLSQNNKFYIREKSANIKNLLNIFKNTIIDKRVDRRKYFINALMEAPNDK